MTSTSHSFMRYPNARILIFARAPQAGFCKTRLIPALGAEGAAQLHHQLVHRTLHTATQAQLCPVELWCADHPEHDFYRDCLTRYGVSLHQQKGDDLGQRMDHALTQALTCSTAAILIGCDCPSFHPALLDEALVALNSHRCVLGPANDGGYVLVGLNQATPFLFQGIHWGEATVLADTRQRLHTQNIGWHELASQHDIDLPGDLQHLPPEIMLNNRKDD